MADQIRYAHGEIKAANGVDYVMDDEIIKHNGVKLKDVVNAAQTALNSKTDKSYVDSELAKKADAAALSGKADASVVAQLQANVNTKADASTVSALSERVSTNETNIATANSRIDEIVAIPPGSTEGNTELIDIRTGADGKKYPTAGDAVRGQVTDLKSDLNQQIDYGYLFDNKWKHGDVEIAERHDFTIDVAAGTYYIRGTCTSSNTEKNKVTLRFYNDDEDLGACYLDANINAESHNSISLNKHSNRVRILASENADPSIGQTATISKLMIADEASKMMSNKEISELISVYNPKMIAADIESQKNSGYLIDNLWKYGDVEVYEYKDYSINLEAGDYTISGRFESDNLDYDKVTIRFYYSDGTEESVYPTSNSTSISSVTKKIEKPVISVRLLSSYNAVNSYNHTAHYSRFIISPDAVKSNVELTELIEKHVNNHSNPHKVTANELILDKTHQFVSDSDINLLHTLLPAPHAFTIEHGSINDDGSLGPHTTRLRTLPININDNYTISFSENNGNYFYYVFYFDNSGVLLSKTSNIPLNKPTDINYSENSGIFRIMFRNVDSSVVLTDDDIEYLNSIMTIQGKSSKANSIPDIINPEKYGAKGDGLADDTLAIQKALDSVSESGGKVELTSNKVYRITSMLSINKSNTIFDGNGATIKSEIESGFILVAKGSVGEESNLRANISSVDGNNSLLNVMHETQTQFNVGDSIILQSQRDALCNDSGLYWCGTQTGSSDTAHWAEPLTINKVENLSHVRCTGTLIYPYYFVNREDGVDVSTASPVREHSTIRKANFLRNVVVRNMKILAYGGSEHKDNTILFALCRDSSIESVVIKKSGNDSHGRCFVFQNCWNCTFENCVADASAIHHENVDVTHVFDNHFTFASSWHCRAIKCFSYHAGQSFDTTYAGIYTDNGFTHVRCPSVDIIISDCNVHGSTDNSATNHSGAWGIEYRGCSFTNCSKAMLIRSPHTTVSECMFMNTVDSAHNPSEFAIYLSEPTIFQCTIVNNTIIGSRGIRVYPYNERSNIPSEILSVLGIEISGNMFQETSGGIYIQRYEPWEQSIDMCINIHDNTFRNTKKYPVIYLYNSNCNGINIKDNTMIACNVPEEFDSLIIKNNSINIRESGNVAVICNAPVNG